MTYPWNSKAYILPLFAQIEANLKLDYGWYYYHFYYYNYSYYYSREYRTFSHEVTEAMIVYHENPLEVEVFSYVNVFLCNKLAELLAT